jgi:hypothetical protein
MKEKFLEFLVENGAYDSYMYHYAKQVRNVSFDEWYEGLRDKSDVLWSAFIWGDTPEGHDYWKDLNKKFLSLIGLE